MSEGSDSKNLVLGLISTGRDRPSVREKPMASPPPAKTDDDGGASPIAAAGRTQFRDLVAKGESDAVAGIGSGMYVPYALRNVKPLPVSPNVARAMLDAEGNAIDDKDHLRLFRLALILERHELATLKMSRTTRGGLRRQTARIVLTDDARQWLESIASGPRDAF